MHVGCGRSSFLQAWAGRSTSCHFDPACRQAGVGRNPSRPTVPAAIQPPGLTQFLPLCSLCSLWFSQMSRRAAPFPLGGRGRRHANGGQAGEGPCVEASSFDHGFRCRKAIGIPLSARNDKLSSTGAPCSTRWEIRHGGHRVSEMSGPTPHACPIQSLVISTLPAGRQA